MSKKKTTRIDAGGVVVADVQAGAPLLIALGDLDEDPTQPRQECADDLQHELIESIAAGGIKQPLLVRPKGDGRYMLVDGARRKRAAEAAGLLDVPCVVTSAAHWLAIKEDQLVTNRMRQDLTVLETAQTLEILWLGHQIAAFEAELVIDGNDTATLVAAAGTPARQIEALRARLCQLSGFENRDAYVGSGKHVRVSWDTVLQTVGMKHMTPDRRKKVLSVLNVSVEAQDALAGVDVSERTLRELAQRPARDQVAIVEQAQGNRDVGTAIREALTAPIAHTTDDPSDAGDWEPDRFNSVLNDGPAQTTGRMPAGDAGDTDDQAAHDGGLPLDVTAERRSTFEPDPTLAMPFSRGKGQTLVADRGEIGRGSVPPAGHDQWSEDDALKLSSLFEGTLTLLDEVGPAYFTEQHKGWLEPMCRELLGRLAHAGLDFNPA